MDLNLVSHRFLFFRINTLGSLRDPLYNLNATRYTSSCDKEGTLVQKKFLIAVNIENKAYLDDPEGDTILRDLIVKGGYSNIESVRSAKTLKIVVRSSSEKEALKTVENLCVDLRIYNPVLSDCTIVSAGLTT